MIRLSELEGMRVVTESGETLGHIWEIQSPGQRRREPPTERRPIDRFLCGRLGLFERLGWREPDAVVVPWDKVLRRDPDALVVIGAAADYARKTP